MGRTIIVGDVHGCGDELGDLLDKTRYAQGVDTLVMVGDLVARGPDSGLAVRRARTAGAIGVRGNHDERVLIWWRAAQAHGRGVADRKIKLSDRHRLAVSQLADEDFVWLSGLPIVRTLPSHELIVVHAGLDPRQAFDAQEPNIAMNIRSIDEHGRPTRTLEGTPWVDHWPGPGHVVFGHDARRGLQLAARCTGLDSGCCYGRELTALVLDDNELVHADAEGRRKQLVAVPARATHCPMGDGKGHE
ncbi:MAG: metallophosphoesterase [Deltaproteobacteria bacterium]|nr:metallophosphoesterase [Deltaproteobacteria bacterium]